MISDEDKKKLEKQPRWIQSLVRNLESAAKRYKEQLESAGGVSKDEAYRKMCYVEEVLGDMVIPFDRDCTIVLQLGPKHYQNVRFKIYDGDHGEAPVIRVFGDSRILISPSGSNSIEIEPVD